MENNNKNLTWKDLSNLFGEEVMLQIKAESELGSGVEGAKNYFEQLAAIKNFYINQE